MLSPRREDAKGRRGILKAKAVVGQGAESSGFRSSEPCSRRVLGLFGQSPAGQAPTRGLGLAVVTKRRNDETTKRRNDQSDQSGQPYGQGEKAVALARALRREGRAWEMDVKEDLARMLCKVGIGRRLGRLRAVQFGA